MQALQQQLRNAQQTAIEREQATKQAAEEAKQRELQSKRREERSQQRERDSQQRERDLQLQLQQEETARAKVQQQLTEALAALHPPTAGKPTTCAGNLVAERADKQLVHAAAACNIL